MSASDFDYDWLVVGSGFGGSVSALRLAEKGYRVGVLEKGRRYTDADLPRSTSDRRAFLWAPALGWRGIMRLRLFKDLFTPTQTGVGGGSLVYGGVLLRARPAFFDDPQWRDLGSWADVLERHYRVAERMLGNAVAASELRDCAPLSRLKPVEATPTMAILSLIGFLALTTWGAF